MPLGISYLKKKILINTSTLDKILTEYKINPDFIKIDTQGADPDKVRNELLQHEIIVEKLNITEEKITLEEGVELINKKRAAPPRKKRRKAKKKTKKSTKKK